ncbi:MAG: hypothetical protein EG825_17855 [Rhodocyclaceae bacterium]|nr:hypothetical protein [Rhodocyclaceae bacterium]
MDQELPKSKGELQIERLMRELDPDSERFRVLASARRFKSSWVELGEKLLAVQAGDRYREWGYASFEEYCSREVHIRRPTVEKLTLAYRFLEREEPHLLARQIELKPLPDFRAVDLLRQAREERQLPVEAYAALRQAVVEDDLSPPTVRKRLREFSPTPDAAAQVAAALAALLRLQKAMAALPALEHRHTENLEQLHAALEEFQNTATD